MNLFIEDKQNEYRKKNLKNIISIIDDISNIEFQKKAWVNKEVHPYATFEETMHQLFDDFELEEVLSDYECYEITNEQYNILNKFYEALDVYSDKHMSWDESVDPKKILNDPKWHKIVKMAKEVLIAFDYKKSQKFI